MGHAATKPDKVNILLCESGVQKKGTKFSSYMCNSVNFQNKRVINGSKQSLCNGLPFPNRLIFNLLRALPKQKCKM